MSKGNRTKGPRVGRPCLPKKEKAKSVTMRLAPGSIRIRADLAKHWRCDKTRAVEEALSLCYELAVTRRLPPLKQRPELDGEPHP
jgi:hypothetical protein